MHKFTRHKMIISPLLLVFMTLTIALSVASAVWSIFGRHIVAIREQAEEHALEKLLIDTKLLQRASRAQFQLGQYFATTFLDRQQDLHESKFPVTAFASLTEKIEQERNAGPDNFSWTIFRFDTANDKTDSMLTEDQIEISSQGGAACFDRKILALFMLKGIEIIADYQLSVDLSYAFGHQMPLRIDERTNAEKAKFICSAIREFQSLQVDDQQYYLMWIPVFSRSAHAENAWLAESEENTGRKDNQQHLAGVVAVVYDEPNFIKAQHQRLFKAIQANFKLTGCSIAIGPPVGEKGGWWLEKSFVDDNELKNILMQRNSGLVRAGKWLKTEGVIPSLQNRRVVLARQLRSESISVRLLRKLIFAGLLFWFAAIVYLCGNHMVLQRKITAGLKVQLVAIVSIFLLPAFMLGNIATERYFDSRQNATLHGLKKRCEEAVLAFDNSIRLYQLKMCANIDWLARTEFEAKDMATIRDMAKFEKESLLKTFLNKIQASGASMRNLMMVDKLGNVTTRLAGSSDSEERFFREFCSSIYSPALNALNFEDLTNAAADNKKLMIRAQADEILDVMKNMLPAELFVSMCNKFASLDQIEGLGDRAFIYHRYLQGKAGPDSAMMMSLYPPSIECVCFNEWVTRFADSFLGSADWVIMLKSAPAWYLRQPFRNSSKDVGFALLRFDYGLLPAEFAYWAGIAAQNPEPMTVEIDWMGKKWLFSTFPGKNLIDYQLSALVPLNDHFKRFSTFKIHLRLAMLAVFLACALVGWYLAGGFVAPVKKFAETAEAIMNGNLSARLSENWADEEFCQIAREFNCVCTDVESGRILRKFVSAGALKVISADVKIDRERALCSTEAVIVFIRLAGFWKMAADKTPAESVVELNRFFSLVCSEINAAGGEVSKFIGEKAMATFTCASEKQLDAKILSALRAIAGIVARYRMISRQCQVRIGIASGRVRSGIIGSEESRLEQTVIGDVVNLAARLCSLEARQSVLMCSHTAEVISIGNSESAAPLNLKKLPGQQIKGKRQVVDIFSISG